jgi:hypothetical protein
MTTVLRQVLIVFFEKNSKGEIDRQYLNKDDFVKHYIEALLNG